MLQAIPALPVKDVAQSVPYYRDQLGFMLVHQEHGFAILRRDAAEIHLWAASDESWRTRSSLPVVSGHESFIAGTASCRIGVEGVEELRRDLLPRGVLHPKAHLADMPWGTREFGVLDPDYNLITFFE